MPGEGHTGVNSVMLVEKREDLAGYSCRVMRIEPGGSTAMHGHPREHVMVPLQGKVRVETGTVAAEAEPGVAVYIPADTPHRFVNPTDRQTVIMVQNLFGKQ